MLDAPGADAVVGAVGGALCASISRSANRALVRPVSVRATPCVDGASVAAVPVYAQSEQRKPPKMRTLSCAAVIVIVSSYVPAHT
jgi:hypothetical protein